MKKISLQTTVIAAFVLFIAIPIIITTTMLSRSYKSALHGNYASQIDMSMAQVQAGIDDEIKRMSLALSVVANDKDLMGLFESWNKEQNASERFSIATQIDRQLNSILSYNSDVNGLVVFYKNGRHYYFRNDLNIQAAKIRKMPWYKEAKLSKGFVDIFGTNGEYLAMQTRARSWDAIISPKAITLDNQIEGIYMNMHSPVLNGMSGSGTKNRGLVILDDGGQIVLEQMQGLSVTGTMLLANQLVPNDSFYISTRQLNHQRWTLVYAVPMDQLTQDIKKLL